MEQMYTGGYSAVVDASKHFYQFRTHPDDWPHLGLIHPVTGEVLIWYGLCMGSTNSPAIACRHGQGLIRKLLSRSKVFRQSAQANCWWTELTYSGYDPNLGYGFKFLRADGKPAVKIWAHIDDFLIHGPDYDSTCQGLKEFLDLALEVGMLCHPKKLKPPAQVQQYVGFLFDTHSFPRLRIPDDKRDRALAMCDFVSSHPPNKPFSRLAMAVIAGTLESLAEATPSRVGHTYLRETHKLIHPDGLPTGRDGYYGRLDRCA